MAFPTPQIEHLQQSPVNSWFRWQTSSCIPAVSLVVPNASLPVRGDSVVGATPIWIARHCTQTYEGRILLRGRCVTRVSDNWPLIMSGRYRKVGGRSGVSSKAGNLRQKSESWDGL